MALELSEKLASSLSSRLHVKTGSATRSRRARPADNCALTDYSSALSDNGGDIRELLVSIASSRDFMHRPAGEE